MVFYLQRDLNTGSSATKPRAQGKWNERKERVRECPQHVTQASPRGEAAIASSVSPSAPGAGCWAEFDVDV